MQTIYEEEVRHVAAGMKWFKRIAESRNQPDLDAYFHSMVRRCKIPQPPLFLSLSLLHFSWFPSLFLFVPPILEHLRMPTLPNRQSFLDMPTGLIPPFNEMARAAAGMGINMYQPLAAIPPARTRNPVTTEFKRSYSSTRNLQNASNKPHCLVVSSQWPETRATAAGLRTMGLLEMLKNSGFEVSFASMAKFPSFLCCDWPSLFLSFFLEM